MKKIIALACAITCIFGLTACGDEVSYTQYEQEKLEVAKQISAQVVVPYMQNFMDDAEATRFDEYTPEEIAYVFNQETYLEADGNAIIGAVTSFNNSADAIGTITEIGTATAVIDDDTIIVTVPITGSLKNGSAEIILSNDRFFVLQSAALNEESNLSDALVKAALNTVIGMGTVFAVLVLIIFIISLFGYIPKIQAWFENRKKKEEVKEESIDNTIAQIVEMEEVDATDDLELVAVIAAAIAASEGAASTDGFVVRSIRKVNRRK